MRFSSTRASSGSTSRPTFANYRATLLGQGPDFFASRQAILDSIIVAMGATLLVAAGGPARRLCPVAHRVPRRGRALFLWVLFQRVLPPIAVIMPLVFIYHRWGLRDTQAGVILAHAAMNLPFAVLLLKSFFDDVPREVGEAAAIDGATRWQSFLRIQLPLVRGGIAATAVLCFIFSWTEFLMALFLTSTIRLLPVQTEPVGDADLGLHLGPQHREHPARLRLHPAGAAAPRPWADDGPGEGVTDPRLPLSHRANDG